jgi:hypothetical protein
MISAIGFMVAAYIFTRLLGICNQAENAFSSKAGKTATLVFAILSMIVTAIIALYLVFASGPKLS